MAAAALGGLTIPDTPTVAKHKPNPKYDLIHKLAPFMDVHLLFPVLNYYLVKGLYKKDDILRAMVELSRPTKMVDFCIGTFQSLPGNEPVPEDLLAHKQAVIDQYEAAEDACDAILAVLEDEELVQSLMENNNWTASYLAQHHEVDAPCIEALYACAKFKYECGEYNIAAKYLFYYGKLAADGSTEELNALWGKLVSEILSEAWDEALQDLNKLKIAIDKSFGTPLQQLQQRSWMLHWSLFIFYNHPQGQDDLVDFFLQHIDTIQNNCPWLLRYLAAAVVTNKRRRNKMDDVVRAIQDEAYTYSDPITRFLERLLVKFEFDGAQEELKECESVLVTDIFLLRFSVDVEVVNNMVADFMHHARMIIFETYCRIHRRIDLAVLASKLNMPLAAAEKWVVDLIGMASLNAKIDCSENHVLMTVKYPSIYQRVINKTKDLSFRSLMLATGLERALYESSNRKHRNKNSGGNKGGNNSSTGAGAGAGAGAVAAAK